MSSDRNPGPSPSRALVAARAALGRVRETFWFLPAVFGVGAVALAIGIVELDRLLLALGVSDDVPLVGDFSATGGRAILTTIGGTMLGVAATSFSITISVLATTSSTYGPRLVRNFMADRGNQFVLAVLTSTFLYSLIVLRSLRTEADSSTAFVPVVSVSVAVVLAVADVGVLVYFIHHIASSVQVTTLLQRVLAELQEAIGRQYPDPVDPRDAGQRRAPLERDAVAVGSPGPGYVQQVDLERVVALAAKYDGVVRVVAPPGSHVLADDPVLTIDAAAELDDRALDDLRASVSVGPDRTPHQDLRFAVQQLVEMAVRGLSSGANDPYTAVGALDALGTVLPRLCGRGGPRDGYRDDRGVLRLVVPWPEPAGLIADVFGAVRVYGTRHPLVLDATLRLADRIEPRAEADERRVLHRELTALRDVHATTEHHALDAAPVSAELNRLITATISSV